MVYFEATHKKNKKKAEMEAKIKKLVRKDPVRVPVTNTAWDEPWQTATRESSNFNSYIEEFE